MTEVANANRLACGRVGWIKVLFDPPRATAEIQLQIASGNVGGQTGKSHSLMGFPPSLSLTSK